VVLLTSVARDIAEKEQLRVVEVAQYIATFLQEHVEIPVYHMGVNGLPSLLQEEGSNERNDAVCSFFNSSWWDPVQRDTYKDSVDMWNADNIAVRHCDVPRLMLSGFEGPPYLDPSHPRYSPKLAAAVRAWEAVSGDDAATQGISVKKALETWLRLNAQKYGLVNAGKPNEYGIAEVAKVANWSTKGGAPKTPVKGRSSYAVSPDPRAA
jgi:hypothetical protein